MKQIDSNLKKVDKQLFKLAGSSVPELIPLRFLQCKTSCIQDLQ